MLTWLYFKLIPGRPDREESVLSRVLEPYVRARRGDWHRWFFLRYDDADGPHLRLRIELPPAAADAAATDRRALRRELERGHDTVVLRDPAINPSRHLIVRPPDVRLAVYEPEYGKWGADLTRAHAMFARSSDLALTLLPVVGPDYARRIGLAALVLDRAAGLAHGRNRFLDHHFRWWSGLSSPAGPPRDEACRDAYAAIRADALAAAASLARDPRVTAALAGLEAALAVAVDEPPPGHDREHQLFHHSHLVLNRLGVPAGEEAVAALLATDLRGGSDG